MIFLCLGIFPLTYTVITKPSKYHYEAFEILLRNFRKIFEMAFAVIFSRFFVSIARISETEKHVSLFPILTSYLSLEENENLKKASALFQLNNF